MSETALIATFVKAFFFSFQFLSQSGVVFFKEHF